MQKAGVENVSIEMFPRASPVGMHLF